VSDVLVLSRRLQERGIACRRCEDGSLMVADPSGNVVHVVADGAST
jgi:hypothetical protein